MGTINTALISRWNGSTTMTTRNPSSLPWTVDSFVSAVRDEGWIGYGNTPLILCNETEVQLTNTWHWFRGATFLYLRHWFWDAELRCRSHERVFWWLDLNVSLHNDFNEN